MNSFFLEFIRLFFSIALELSVYIGILPDGVPQFIRPEGNILPQMPFPLSAHTMAIISSLPMRQARFSRTSSMAMG